MSELAITPERLRAIVAGAMDFNGAIMAEWNEVHGTVLGKPSSAVPRLMYESNILTGALMAAAAELTRLTALCEAYRAALENARRDLFSVAPKKGSRSPIRAVVEAAVERIEAALNQQNTSVAKETK